MVRCRSRLPVVIGLVVFFYALVNFIPRGRETLRVPEAIFVKSSFDWSRVPRRYPIDPSEQASLPEGRPKRLPAVQHEFTGLSEQRQRLLEGRRGEVADAFSKSWDSYKARAWMFDELAPVSGAPRNTFGGWAATLVDALDTLWIMGMEDDFHDAVAAVARIDWSATEETACNFFETTIRHLGGLLSAYDLSREGVLLQKAVELGDMLLMAFDTPSRMPPFWLDFDRARRGLLRPGTNDPSASSTSSGLEFTRLAQLTGESKYYDAVDRVTRVLDRAQNSTSMPGMWPTLIDMEGLRFEGLDFTLGALADSLYELLPKMFIILGGLEPVYEKMYRDAMGAVIVNLLFRPKLPDQADLLFSGNAFVSEDLKTVRLEPEVQHLACMFGLGGKLFEIEEHLRIGEKITRGCVWAYDSMASGIMPEISGLLPCPTLDACDWDEAEWTAAAAAAGDQKAALRRGFTHARDPRYLLRPEAVESVFLMYRMTGDEAYQDAAWRMFEAVRRATETDLAFSAIADVTVDGGSTEKTDSMESFWLSETLKYFYLIFSPPDLISLDEYVLNTEAHPLRRPDPR
ncbi:glycoside hydrolase family 47 protein [Xylariaceae sp. FL0804]|nr:glycoside hydrolase family 47 protein [Xylariaceae sp. FL0804]